MRSEAWFAALNKNISSEIKRRREAAGLSINALATSSKISWDMVKAVETGKHRPSIETLARLAVSLGSTPAEILAAAEKGIR